MFTEYQQKHLEFIQNVITRMAQNSFLIKGWTITILSGLFLVSSIADLKLLVIVPIIPTLAFWGLDSYYLRQERLFRTLYKKASVAYKNKDLTFNAFSMDTSPYNSEVASWGRILVSKTEFWFYFVIYFVTIAVDILIFLK